MTFLQPFFIGLGGPDGVGKSTVQQALRQIDWRNVGHAHPDVVVRPMSFATRLYEAVSAMFGVPISEIKARKNEVFTYRTAPHPSLVGKSFRYVLRNFATEYVRDQLSAEHWVNCVLKDAPKVQEDTYAKHLIVVMDDLRFVNEIGICDLVIELERDGIAYDGQHRSSQGLPKHLIDATVSNNNDTKFTAESIAAMALDKFAKHAAYFNTHIMDHLGSAIAVSAAAPAEERRLGGMLGLTVRDERRLDAHVDHDLGFRSLMLTSKNNIFNVDGFYYGAPRTSYEFTPVPPKAA